MFSSEKTKKKILARRKKAKEAISTTHLRYEFEGLFGDFYKDDQLYFAEEVRKALHRGNLMIMRKQVLPITPFKDEVCWSHFNELKMSRFDDPLKLMLAYHERIKAEHEARLAKIGEELEKELKEAGITPEELEAFLKAQLEEENK